jgi:AcrR family transcriptional regulator
MDRRAEILDTAAAVFASSGYVATSLKDVADACGIQAGSLYHHFNSKEAIVVELVARFQAEMASIGDAALKAAAETVPPQAMPPKTMPSRPASGSSPCARRSPNAPSPTARRCS